MTFHNQHFAVSSVLRKPDGHYILTIGKLRAETVRSCCKDQPCRKKNYTKETMNFSHINIQKISGSFLTKRIPFTHVYFGAALPSFEHKCYKYNILGLKLQHRGLNNWSFLFQYRITQVILVWIGFVLFSDSLQSSG